MVGQKFTTFFVVAVGAGIVTYNNLKAAYLSVFLPFNLSQFLGFGIVLIASIFYIGYNWRGK